jgi:hypothetical protein
VESAGSCTQGQEEGVAAAVAESLQVCGTAPGCGSDAPRIPPGLEEQPAAGPRLQCDFGEKAAFDSIIGEKLMTFAEAAERHPRCAQELPAFVAALRRLFSQEVRKHG